MMNANTALVNEFYSAFQQLDYKRMNNCYADDIVFFDPVFGILRGEEAKCMWAMLCNNAKDFSLEYGNIHSDDDTYYTCDWTARYTFSKTGRRVENKIKAYMLIENGKISEHSDAFSLHRWAKQAMGFSGWLLGWNRFYQRKIKNAARRNLLKYMKREGNY